MIELFEAGGGPYPYGASMLAVGFVWKPVTFRLTGVPVGVTGGRGRIFVAATVISADVTE